ncbi:MAG: hypothetical protein NTW08_08840 [Gammaproteobacteria bacterium]|nr:hypothetical protein [Gammaproteobacteria bacterium]
MKIAFVGPANSGKKSVVSRLAHNSKPDADAWQLPEYVSSLWSDLTKVGETKLWILPINSLQASILRDADHVFYCVDLSGHIDEKTLKGNFLEIQGVITSSTVIHLLGTKADIEKPGNQAVLQRVAGELKLTTKPKNVSAKTGFGMEAFYARYISGAPQDAESSELAGSLTGSSAPSVYDTLPPDSKDSTIELAPCTQTLSLANFYEDIESLPCLRQRRLKAEAEKLRAFVRSNVHSEEQKTQEINAFIKRCHLIIDSPYSFAMKAVASFAMGVLVTVLAAALGFGIGMAAGAWIGPLAFFAAIQVANTVALSVLAVGALVGAGSAYATCRMFRDVSEAKRDVINPTLEGVAPIAV